MAGGSSQWEPATASTPLSPRRGKPELHPPIMRLLSGRLVALLVLGAWAVYEPGHEALRQHLMGQQQQHDMNMFSSDIQQRFMMQASVRLQLKRIAPGDFERSRQVWSASGKAAVVLFCCHLHRRVFSPHYC